VFKWTVLHWNLNLVNRSYVQEYIWATESPCGGRSFLGSW
jgi:hypothetical protein